MSSGGSFKPGDMVVLSSLPPGLLDDLPPEDQEAIQAVVGKPVLFNEIDQHGRAELQFTDKNGTVHFIWVAPELLTTEN